MTDRRLRIQNPISRRQFLTRSGLSLSAMLVACGGDVPSGSGGSTPDDGGGNSLLFENWPVYIDHGEDGAIGTVDRFREATGVDMRYSEAYNDNNEYFAKIQPILGAGDAIDPDILAPTYWMVARLIRLGWVDKLPLDQIPNLANLEDGFENPTWDPTGEYSLPWQSVMAGIAYNLDATGRELGSINDLFAPDLKGKMGMNTEMRDTMGLLMLGLGIDPSTHRPSPRSTRRRQRSNSSSEPRTMARSVHSTATTTLMTCQAGTSPLASAGRATFCSSPRTIRTSVL